MADDGTGGALIETIRHNTWATKQLLRSCRDLTREQLRSATTGTYGDIVATFNHIVGSEGHYLRSLSGITPDWLQDGSDDLDQLLGRVEDLESRWEQVLSEPVDPERVIIVDRGAYAVRAGVIVAQVLHHGNAHREQICAILTSLDIDAPDLQPWAYAWDTGRIWKHDATGQAAATG